jgi:integrase
LIEVLPFETRIQPPVYHQYRPGLRRPVRPLRDDSLVFATWNGQPRSPNACSGLVGKNGGFGLEDCSSRLRHTHASQLIAAGMDVVAISRRLGHASPTITLNVYGHLFSNTDDSAAEIVEVASSRRRTE